MHSHLHSHPALLSATRKLEQLGLDKYEIYYLRKIATKIDSKDQEVESLTRSEDVGLSIRTLKNHRMGFSYTTSLEKEAIERAVEAAVEISKHLPEDPLVDLFSFSSAVYPAVDTFDQKGMNSALEQKIALAKEIEAECRKADRRVTGVRSASLGEIAFEAQMVDSGGEHIQHQTTLYTAHVTCKAEEDGDSQVGHEFDFSNDLDRLDPREVGRLAARWATELLGAKQAPTLKCPAVFRNSVISELLDFLSASFSAENIDKGRSMLAGKQGEKIFSEEVTLLDDGLLPGGFSTAPFDGEGIPSTTTTLINGGFFTNALYDSYYARKSGKTSTGNATRSLKAPPSIGVSNLHMKRGKKSFDQLVGGISKGILITDLMGVHTANPVTGDFSLGASGILIENGNLTRPVRGFAVAGNILEVFRRITDVGDDLRFFGNVGAPTVRVSEISVGGT